MNECDYNHLLLYAKNWYERGNVLDDLKKIMGHRCNIDPKHMGNWDVWEMCVEAFMAYCKSDFDTKSLLRDLFKPRPEEGGSFSFWSDESSVERAVRCILCHLGNVVVRDNEKDILCLGEPDPKILPLSESARKKVEP